MKLFEQKFVEFFHGKLLSFFNQDTRIDGSLCFATDKESFFTQRDGKIFEVGQVVGLDTDEEREALVAPHPDKIYYVRATRDWWVRKDDEWVPLFGDLFANLLTEARELVPSINELKITMDEKYRILRAHTDDTATAIREELAEAKDTLNSRIDEKYETLSTQIVNTATEIRGELADTAQAIRGELDTTATEIRSELATTATEIRSELSTTATEIRGEMADNKDYLIEKINNLDTTLNTKIDNTAIEIRNEISEFQDDFTEFKETVILFKSEIDNKYTVLRGEFETFRDEVIDKFEIVENKIQAVADDLYEFKGDINGRLAITNQNLADFKEATGITIESIINNFNNLQYLKSAEHDATTGILTLTNKNNQTTEVQIPGLVESATVEDDHLILYFQGGASISVELGSIVPIMTGSVGVNIEISIDNNQISGILLVNSVTNAQLVHVPTATFKGRVTAGTGEVEDLNMHQARSLLAFHVVAGNGTSGGSVTNPTDGTNADIQINLRQPVSINATSTNTEGNTTTGHTHQLDDYSVITAKIANQAVDMYKLARGVGVIRSSNINANPSWGLVQTDDITDLNVTTEKIANNAVNGSKLFQHSYTGNRILRASQNADPVWAQLTLTTDVTGTLPVANGGTNITSDPSMLVNLGSTAATNVFQTSPRPGVEGTLGTGNGGTGINSNPSMLVNLGSTVAANVFATSPQPGITGTLGTGNGGTGITSNPSMLTNLGTTTAANVFQTSPRPGITGTLGAGNGGTGLTAAPSLRTNLASTSATGIFTASPRPGIEGILGQNNGGTGHTTLAAALLALPPI